MGKAWVSVYLLGGTIASVPNQDGKEAVPLLDAASIVDSVRAYSGNLKVRSHTFSRKASGDLSIVEIVELYDQIVRSFEDGAAGAVVLQGTDTIEETAFLLDILSDRLEPIVVTGAMRHSGAAGGDGPSNVLSACHVAASASARGLGALVVFSDYVHLARFVRKAHTFSLGAFKSGDLGPIGWVSEGEVRIPLVPRRRSPHIMPDPAKLGDLPRVLRVSIGFGEPVDTLSRFDAASLDGLVVEALGGGHVPSWLMSELRALAERMPVVFASRAGEGEVLSSTYGFPGSEADLLRSGCIGSGVLGGAKARLLLVMLLAAGASGSEIASTFSVDRW